MAAGISTAALPRGKNGPLLAGSLVNRLTIEAEPAGYPGVRLLGVKNPAIEMLGDLTAGGMSAPLPGV